MKYFLTSGIFLCVTLVAAVAQPVIYHAEKHAIEDSANYIQVQNPETVKEGNSGADILWKFSNLKQDKVILQKIMPVSETPYASEFADADYAKYTNDGKFSFIKINGNQTMLTGFVQENVGLKMIYSKPAVLMQRPLTFNDSFLSNYRYNYIVAGQEYKGSATAKFKVDAFGTLQLPGKTYENVLRIRSHQISYDTVVNSGMVTTIEIATFKWYHAAHISPLLIKDSISINSQFFSDIQEFVYYQQNGETTSLIEKDQKVSAFSYAYVQQNQLVLGGNFESGKLYNIQISNLLGQTIFMEKTIAESKNIIKLPINSYAIKNGIYIITATSVNASSIEIYRIKTYLNNH